MNLLRNFILLLPHYIPLFFTNMFVILFLVRNNIIQPPKLHLRKTVVIIKKTNGDPLLGQFQLRKPVTSLDA